MSLYADYLAERSSDKIIEGTSGFATYRYLNDGKSVYVIDIYTVPSERKKGAASLLADLVAKEAKEHGCIEMLGTVVPSAKGSTISLRVLLGYGFELQSADKDLVVFRKDI